MEQGMTEAMSQMDAVLADLASFAAGNGTTTQILSDTQVSHHPDHPRRGADGVASPHEPALLQRWLLGPDGWTMPVCEVATRSARPTGMSGKRPTAATGSVHRFAAGIPPPHRAVTTEAMIGMEETSTTNELTLTAVDGEP